MAEWPDGSGRRLAAGAPKESVTAAESAMAEAREVWRVFGGTLCSVSVRSVVKNTTTNSGNHTAADTGYSGIKLYLVNLQE